MTGYVTLSLFLVIMGVIIYLFILGLKIVQQGESMVIERLGKYNRTLRPGINVIIPFIDKARMILKVELEYLPDGTTREKSKWVDRISLQQCNLDFQKQDVIN